MIFFLYNLKSEDCVEVGRGGKSPVLCFPRALEKYILRPILVKNTLHFFSSLLINF